MLRGIPRVISPDMMKILMEMGHGDELVLADGNFPGVTCAKRLVRADGLGIAELLEAILPFFPLDRRVERPAALMALLPGEEAPQVWEKYAELIHKSEAAFKGFEQVERFSFYERAKNAFAVILTSDSAFKGNVLIKKGVVLPGE